MSIKKDIVLIKKHTTSYLKDKTIILSRMKSLKEGFISNLSKNHKLEIS